MYARSNTKSVLTITRRDGTTVTETVHGGGLGAYGKAWDRAGGRLWTGDTRILANTEQTDKVTVRHGDIVETVTVTLIVKEK